MFTQQRIRGLKATATDRRQEHRDLGGQNLYVVVQPRSGEISFVIRPTVLGKQRRVTIGHFPAMSLAEAREEAVRRKADLSGASPLSDASEATVGASITVNEAWDLYWEHEASLRKSADEKTRIFRKDVAPSLGRKVLKEVTRGDLAALVGLKFTSAKTASNRLHSLLGRFFKWCCTHGQTLTGLETNPMDSVAKMHSERSSARTRYLSRTELVWWMNALPAAGDYQPIHALLMRTLCRFSDVFDLTWEQVVQRDGGDLVLEIADTKNGQPHVVYLHPSAAALLPVRPDDAKPKDRIFKLTSRSDKPVRRLRKRMQEFASHAGQMVQQWQPHDYRRTGVTHLAAMVDEQDNPLVVDHILDRLLGHKEQRVVRHYNIYSYYKEKKIALRIWNEHLNRLHAENSV